MSFDLARAQALVAAALEVEPEKKESRKKTSRDIGELKEPKKRSVNINGMDKEIAQQETKSEFVEVRHLVEYLLIKHPQIRYEQSAVLVKKHFPAKNYDNGNFTWFKLEMFKYGKAKFQEQIDAQLKSTTDK